MFFDIEKTANANAHFEGTVLNEAAMEKVNILRNHADAILRITHAVPSVFRIKCEDTMNSHRHWSAYITMPGIITVANDALREHLAAMMSECDNFTIARSVEGENVILTVCVENLWS